MQQFDAQLLEAIEEVSEYFAIETIQRWMKAIRRRKLVNTKQLINSLDQETRKDLSRLVVVMNFAFEDYGRFQDIKKKKWSSQPPIDKILEWVKSKGIESFGTDPRPYKTKPKTEERRLNEIAWGIAKHKSSRNYRDKSKPWFQSTFYRSLNALYEELSLGIADRSIDAFKEALTDRLKKGAGVKYF